jgi:hypothetical protein
VSTRSRAKDANDSKWMKNAGSPSTLPSYGL